MVKEIFFHNGRRTWGVDTPAVRKALEEQFGSKIKSIGGKLIKRRSTPAKKKTSTSSPKKNLARDRKYVSNEKHELAYNKAHPSKRTGYKGVIKANPGMLVAMEVAKQKQEEKAKRQEFKDAHGGKEQWELDIPKEYQKYMSGGQLSDKDQAFHDLVAEYMNENPGMYETVATKLAYDDLGYYPKYSQTQYKTGGKTSDHEFTYMMLSRMEDDNDYFLGNGNGSERSLYMKDVKKQIQEMKRLWKSLPKDGKPEWLTMEQINEYETKMTGYTPKAKKGAKTGVEYETKPIKGQAKSHKKNTHFAFHKPTKSMVFSWDYKGYERDELYSYGGDDYFWTDVKDQVEANIDKFRKQDFEIVERKNLAKKGYDLDDYKVFQGQKYDKAEKGSKTPEYVYTEWGYNNKAGMKHYTHAQAIKRIKSLLKEDPDALGSDNLNKMSDDDILDKGWTWYDFDNYDEELSKEYAKHGSKTGVSVSMPVSKITTPYTYMKKELEGIKGYVEVKVEKRDTSKMKGPQDPYIMVVYQKGKKIANFGSVPSLASGKASLENLKTPKAKKGSKTKSKKEYLVMNNTDGITASFDTFKTKAQAQKFINDFPKRYEAQGYYRTNTWEKINPKDVELEIVEIDPDKLEFGTGGIILAGIIGAYVGYKVGRAKPQKKGFDTEKKYADKIRRKAGETAQAYKERKQKKQNK
jgi:Large polyvalent protein-associated domain 11